MEQAGIKGSNNTSFIKYFMRKREKKFSYFHLFSFSSFKQKSSLIRVPCDWACKLRSFYFQELFTLSLNLLFPPPPRSIVMFPVLFAISHVHSCSRLVLVLRYVLRKVSTMSQAFSKSPISHPDFNRWHYLCGILCVLLLKSFAYHIF